MTRRERQIERIYEIIQEMKKRETVKEQKRNNTTCNIKSNFTTGTNTRQNAERNKTTN